MDGRSTSGTCQWRERAVKCGFYVSCIRCENHPFALGSGSDLQVVHWLAGTWVVSVLITIVFYIWSLEETGHDLSLVPKHVEAHARLMHLHQNSSRTQGEADKHVEPLSFHREWPMAVRHTRMARVSCWMSIWKPVNNMDLGVEKKKASGSGDGG